MRKILHILGTLAVGGTESQVFEVLSRLDRSRWEPHVAWLAGPAELAPRFAAAGIPAHDLRSTDPLRAASLRATLRLLHRLEPSVVHTHLAAADFAGGTAGRLAGVPAVVSTRHYEDPLLGFLPTAMAAKAVAALPHRIVVVSDAVGRSLTARLGVRPDRIVPIRYGQPGNGAAVGRDPAARSVLRRRLGLPPGTKIVACIAKLSETKGLLDLVRAASLLREALPEAHYLVAGRGELRPRLEAWIGELGLSGVFHLLGFRSDVTSLLRGSDLLVLPSRLEGFGLVLLEAMETGLPVVGTRVGAIPEVVADGETGILVPPRDPDALAAALLRVLTWSDVADAMGRAGRARVRSEFSIDRAVRAHERLYEDLLGHFAGGPAAC